jgi:hypothetical protein
MLKRGHERFSMRIKVWASVEPRFPDQGPYKMLDIIERDAPYNVGEMTHYGAAIVIPPPIPPFIDDVDQSVIVKLNPESVNTWCEDSVFDKPPTSYDKIEFFPIVVDTLRLSGEPPLACPYTILETENLTIEDVSHLITPDTFSLWKRDCFVSKDIASALDNVKYAIVHRYSSQIERHPGLDKQSANLIDFAVSCLALIRPTRKSHAMHIPGVIRPDGRFDPQGFSARHEVADVPEIQKLFTIREKDIKLLTSVLPEFIQLYQKDEKGRLKDDYEPIRMAVQLYGEAYSLSYWKARHILWWSAIEAIYGNSDDAAMARIYALFGNKNLVDGYNCPIYEREDIPSCFFPSSESLHTLGKMVPLIYEVRNASAHGQKVPDSHFVPVPHPLGQGVVGIDALAEAATFIIRKTIMEILQRGWKDDFTNRAAREKFWLKNYALPKNQCAKRLREMDNSLRQA